MCGIIGYINGSAHAANWDKRKFIEQALVIDTLRGDDGTGLFTVDNSGRLKLLKDIADGYAFTNSEEFVKTFPTGDWGDYRFAVGHNRSATLGGISTEATHPFREGPITLVHNGTIHDTSHLKASQHTLKAENDSHTICHNLAISSPEEVIAKLPGAFTLVWHDSRDDSLNMVRNTHRPLHIAKARQHNTLFFASEGPMLYWLDDRIQIGLQDIVSLKPAHWLKFKGAGQELMLPEVKQVSLYTYHYQPRPTTVTNYKHSPHHGGVCGGDDDEADAWGKVYGAGNSEANERQSTVPALMSPAHAGPAGVNPQARSSFSGIKINGKNRSIPKDVEYDLCEYNLFLDETYKFVPCRADPLNINILTVTGYLVDVPETKGNILCCMYGIPREIWEKGSARMWEVRPVGIKGLTDNLDIVVGRLVSTNPKDGTALLPNARQLPKNPVGRPVVIIPKAPEMVQGPHGQEVTLKEFLKVTESGCIQCTEPIKPEDAQTIEWTNDRQDPLCLGCQQDLEKWSAGRTQQASNQVTTH